MKKFEKELSSSWQKIADLSSFGNIYPNHKIQNWCQWQFLNEVYAFITDKQIQSTDKSCFFFV